MFFDHHPVSFTCNSRKCREIIVNALMKDELDLLTLNIPSLARQRCLPSWGLPRISCFYFFLVISQLFDAVDYSNYDFWVSETIIQ